MRNKNRNIDGKHDLSLIARTPIALIRQWLLILLLLTSGGYSLASGEDAKVFRTGLEANRAHVSVSSDGKRLLFDTDRIAHGLRLLDLSNGETQIVPAEAGRTLGFPSWSPDGQHVAAVSAAVRDGFYSVDDMKIILIDSTMWTSRTIASGDGVKFSPFFSDDGKTVYYFKGIKRESGKTPASRYDLFAIDLAKGQEVKLTQEEFYQAGEGDDDSNNLIFQAIGGAPSLQMPDAFSKKGRPTLLLFNKASKSLSAVRVDQSSGIFNFSRPKWDKAGNLYFVGAKRRPGGGHFLWFLVRADKDGSNPVTLTELPISMGFDIARNTGDIYVTDKDGKELIIRKLPVKAAD